MTCERKEIDVTRGTDISLSALLGVLALAACATTPEQQVARTETEARLNAEIKARQGRSVSQICPRGSDGWQPLGDDAVLLEARGDWYLIELSGACDTGSATAGIATRGGPGSGCLARGDAIFTGRPRSGGRCVITALYEWNEDAEVPAPAGTPPVGDRGRVVPSGQR
jgi:hypothetical protein